MIKVIAVCESGKVLHFKSLKSCQDFFSKEFMQKRTIKKAIETGLPVYYNLEKYYIDEEQ